MKTPFLLLLRLLLGACFVYAAVLKLGDPSAFIEAIGRYRLLPYPAALVFGLWLPWVELFCGLALLLRRAEQGALLLLSFLCTVFSLALASAWLRGLDIDCACFGGEPSWTSSVPVALLRALILGGLCLFLLRKVSGCMNCEGKQ